MWQKKLVFCPKKFFQSGYLDVDENWCWVKKISNADRVDDLPVNYLYHNFRIHEGMQDEEAHLLFPLIRACSNLGILILSMKLKPNIMLWCGFADTNKHRLDDCFQPIVFIKLAWVGLLQFHQNKERYTSSTLPIVATSILNFCLIIAF